MNTRTFSIRNLLDVTLVFTPAPCPRHARVHERKIRAAVASLPRSRQSCRVAVLVPDDLGHINDAALPDLGKIDRLVVGAPLHPSDCERLGKGCGLRHQGLVSRVSDEDGSIADAFAAHFR